MADHDETTAPKSSPPPAAIPPPGPRRQAATARPALPPEIEEQFANLLLSVQALANHFIPEPAESPEDTTRDKAGRRSRKFSRRAGDERGTASAAGGTQPGGGADTNAETPGARNPVAWPRLTGLVPAPTPSDLWNGRPTLGFWLIAQAVGLVLLVLGFWLGHIVAGTGRASSPVHQTGTDLLGPSEPTEQAYTVANEGLQAEHAGNAETARKVYETALKNHVPLTGLHYRLALLAVQRNDLVEAETHLEKSIQSGENIAPCCYVLARIAADKGDLLESTNQFQRATRAQPFDSRYFFYVAESLRRQGKPQEALAVFDQVFDRPFTPDGGDLYLFKQRLTKLEFGHDDAFNADLAAHLKQQNVTGDWLLLAAAQDLDHSAFEAAATRLKQASERLPSTVYNSRIRDYIFQSQAKHPELTAALGGATAPVISAAGPTVLDPASWLPERGDPATWPSAAGAPVK